MITTATSPSVQRQQQQKQNLGGSFIHSHGTKVFMRPKLDDVLDAVQQARFNEKRWVWIEHEQYGYVRAHVLQDSDGVIEVELDSGLTTRVESDKVYPMNPPKFDMVEDMAELTYLNEPSVIHNLTLRYKADHVYTYSGLFLVAVNPYRKLPIYSDDSIQSYRGRRRGEMPPHIYAVADQAYHDMLQDKENQSILITGESGAGKTENTKIVIQYLTTVANTKRDNKLEQQILQANPILEAFGNAQTIRNNNSSRFGKFIRIEFNMQAQISGANIEWYLLEKSRVHQQSPQERNYHIFYQLLNADESIKEQLLLGNGRPSDYGYTKDSNSVIDGVDDAEEFKTLMKSLDIMGLEHKEKLDLFRIIAAVLHLGNLVVTPDYRGDRADIKDFAAVERVCHLLGIPAQDFKNSLLSPRIKAGRDWVNQSKSPSQVKASLDALAKTLYERNFASLVERVNHAIDGKKLSDKMGFIGVLDIAGFEIFKVNSFEQLCINYTNEKLQQFFNHNMFVLEQEEYQREKINWSYIDFGLDLQPTIDLIEKTNPIGILSCLEEECVAPRGNDDRFLEKLSKIWDNDEGDAKYKSTRFKDGFIVKHYAGDVEYSTSGWIDKNKDPLNEDTTRLLARSTQRYVAGLFEDYLNDTTGSDYRDIKQQYHQRGSPTTTLSTRSSMVSSSAASSPSSSSLTLFKLRKGGGSFRTVGQRHKQQLLSLMNTLYMTHPHFVRCILPNDCKHSGEIQTKLVLDQLRCNGVLEGIRICRKGFPNRLSFADFRKRYEILCPTILKPNQFIDGRTACQQLLDQMELEPEKYRIGTTKIFFKATVLAELEEVRDRRLGDYITDFQAYCRRFIARRHMTRFARQTDAIKVMQRNARIYVTLREWPWWKMYAMLKPLSEFYETDALLKKQEKDIQDMKEQLEAQQQQIESITGRNKQLESEQDEYKSLLESEQAISRDLQDSQQSLLVDMNSAEERHEEALVALDEARDQIDALKHQLEVSQQENAAQGAMIATLHQDIRECSDDNDKLAAECEKWSVDYASLQETEQTLRAELAQKDQRLETLEKEHHVLEEEHTKDTEETEAKLKSLQGALDTYKADLESETHARKNVEQRCGELEGQLDEIRKALEVESTQRREWQSKHASLQVDWDNLTRLVKSEADETRSRATRLDQVLANLKFKMDSSD